MRDKVFSKKEFIASVTENVKTMYRKTLKEATQQEIYQAVSLAVKDVVMDEWMATQQVIEKDDPKILYYMSMEFLMGRALGNNLINLGAYGEVKEALEEIGLDLSVIEDQEPDPAWKWRTWPAGSMFYGFSCYSGLCRIWMWNPLPLRYVQAADY